MVLTPKGTVQRDFRPPVFFHHSNQPGPLINKFKYFHFYLGFHWDIGTSVSKKVTRRGMVPRGDWPTGVIDLPGYHTPGSHTPGSHVLAAFYWLAGVWYPGEIDLRGYDIPGSQFFGLKIRITLRILNQIQKYFNPLVSSQGWFKWGKKLEVENLVGLTFELSR